MIKDQRNNTFSTIKAQLNCTSLYKKHANPKFTYNFWDYDPKNHI